ncbi:translation initiation factor IF-1 [Candidatus Vidania fulgoroideorum]
MSDKKEKIYEEGIIVESLPNANFKVKTDNGYIKLCYLAGKVRINYIKIFPGDRVRVEFDAYDPRRGRIVFRIK